MPASADVQASAVKTHRITAFSVWFLTIFLVLVPKGGIKAGATPLTWGYFYIFLTAPVLIVVRLLTLPLTFRRPQLMALLCLVPLQLIIVYDAVFIGVLNPAYAVSDVVGIFALPWLFLLLYPSFYPFINGGSLARWLRFSMLAAAIWGIFLFFWHPITGHYIEIPYLTVNSGDFGELENTKHIARGLFFKLISTYNNGNLYGTCTLLLYPFWLLVEPSRWRRVVLRIAIILSLSRTVWIGIIITELYLLAGPLLQQVKTFPVVRLGEASRRVLMLAVSVGLILSALLFNSSRLSFLFDSHLGGRDQGLVGAFSSGLLPGYPLSAFQEIMYATALEMFGWVGLATFTLWMFSPLLVLAADTSALQSPFRNAAFRSLMFYAIIAGIDGGLNYIPVMAFYHFAWMVFIFGWPGGDLQPVTLTKFRWRHRFAVVQRILVPREASVTALEKQGLS